MSIPFLGCCIAIIAAAVPATTAPVNSVATSETDYTIESFDGIPSDWNLFDSCDVSHTTAAANDGILTIRHSNTSVTSKSYYGSLYQIGDFDYSDFTFEITFKMTDAANPFRWMSILYHSRVEESNLIGYMTAYRYDGSIYSSAVTKERTFLNDSGSSTFALSDGTYHTLKIVMAGNTCSHYVDGGLVQEWNVSSKTAQLGETLASGGFGLIVNQSAVSIRALRIQNYAEEDPYVVDNDIVNTYSCPTSLINAPTVVSDVKDAAALDLLKQSILPSNAILRVNSQLEVTDAEKRSIGAFDEIYTSILKGRVIPILKIEDTETAQAFLTYFDTIRDILDIAVMTQDPAIVSFMKAEKPNLRGIIEFSSVESACDIVRTLNMNFANVAVLSEDLASEELITAVHARFKTVWTLLNDDGDTSIYNAIASGTYGIVTADFQKVYSVYSAFTQTTYTRSPFNVAHRGLPKTYNENSLGGIKAAIASGATHVEIDGYLTTDGEIAMMHDATIDRTSNGSGSIETMHSEELRQYQLDLVEPYEPIPLFQEIIPEVKKTDAIVILEIKSGKPALIDRLRELLIEYDFFDQCVVISFNLPMLKLMKEKIPEIPTANLNAATQASFANVLVWMGEYNTGIDTTGSGNRTFNEAYLRDRGIVGWFWTFNEPGDVAYAWNLGLTGLTNNCADDSADQVRSVCGVAGQEASALAPGMKVEIETVSYNGTLRKEEGTVIHLTEKNGQYLVIARSEGTYPLLTEAFAVTKKGGEPNPEVGEEPSIEPSPDSSPGNPIVWIVLGSIAGIALIGGLACYLIRRRKAS